ncbi:MAG: hypothetical protein HKP44_09945 [Desulfofustis sp.]|nr:hypothetical protein [Desulfofustis sp.]
MKNILLASFCTLMFCSSVWASLRTGVLAEGTCTSDFNPWAHSSQCSCTQGSTYDQRAGLCLDDADVEEITILGPIKAGMAANGGETAGFEITSKKGDIYDLIFEVADQEKLRTFDKMRFEVSGELIIIEGVERKRRTAIIAETLKVFE